MVAHKNKLNQLRSLVLVFIIQILIENTLFKFFRGEYTYISVSIIFIINLFVFYLRNNFRLFFSLQVVCFGWQLIEYIPHYFYFNAFSFFNRVHYFFLNTKEFVWALYLF